MLHWGWRKALRDRSAGGGLKPPQAAAVKSRGGERCGKRRATARQVRARKANMREPPGTCRKRRDDAKTEVESLPREELGGNLLTAQAVSGIEVARAWFRPWCGRLEPGLRYCDGGCGVGTRRSREGGPQAAESARGGVPMRSTGADRLVVARKPGNAGGAKGTGCLGSVGGQPLEDGRSR